MDVKRVRYSVCRMVDMMDMKWVAKWVEESACVYLLSAPMSADPSVDLWVVESVGMMGCTRESMRGRALVGW